MQTHRISLTLAALATAATFTAGAADAPQKWESSAGLNFTLTSGNSDTFLVGGNVLTATKWDKNEFSGSADVAYGQNTTKTVAGGSLVETKTTTAQNYGAGLQYNRLVWEDRGYFYTKGDGRQDKIAGVTYRATVSPGIGYYFYKQATFELSGEVGPGFVFEKLIGQPSHDYVTLRVGEKLKWNITDHSRLFQNADYQPAVDDFTRDYVINFSTKLETDITKALKLNVTLADTYRSLPAPYAGTSPLVFRKKNDVQITAGVSYSF
jgi:putative salt-induced outer membrane protein YdiY